MGSVRICYLMRTVLYEALLWVLIIVMKRSQGNTCTDAEMAHVTFISGDYGRHHSGLSAEVRDPVPERLMS